MGKIVTIVPAYNEEPRIAAVLDVLTTVDYLSEIIVVNDGSKDGTGIVAGEYDVRLLEHEENLGKGAALQTGIDHSSGADYFLFLDADLIGLSRDHLDQLLEPLLGRGGISMSIGVFQEGPPLVRFAQNMFPVLNGQRALKESLVKRLPDLSWSRFGVEILLNRCCEAMDENIEWVPLKNISHWIKEKKDGWGPGLRHRLKMYRECIVCQLTCKKKLEIFFGEEHQKP